jgi:hypothetical protein
MIPRNIINKDETAFFTVTTRPSILHRLKFHIFSATCLIVLDERSETTAVVLSDGVISSGNTFATVKPFRQKNRIRIIYSLQ